MLFPIDVLAISALTAGPYLSYCNGNVSLFRNSTCSSTLTLFNIHTRTMSSIIEVLYSLFFGLFIFCSKIRRGLRNSDF